MSFIPRPSDPHPFPRKKELLRHSVYFSGISNQRPRVQNASMTATLYHTKQHLWTQFVFFDIENDIALCLLLSLQLYVLSVIWHAFILKASSRCWQEVVVAMETRKVSQRAELVIKSAIIKPTHLEGRYDWSIVLSFDITLSFSYYSGPSVNRREARYSNWHSNRDWTGRFQGFIYLEMLFY